MQLILFAGPPLMSETLMGLSIDSVSRMRRHVCECQALDDYASTVNKRRHSRVALCIVTFFLKNIYIFLTGIQQDKN